jgi:hypothetical protein
MQEILIQKLHGYIVRNNPDLLVLLQDSASVNRYLEDKVSSVEGLIIEMGTQGKPAYIIEEACIEAITRDLRPSKYNYLLAVLMDFYEEEYENMLETGTLTYEVINLTTYCQPVFDENGLTDENEGDKGLRERVAQKVGEYLQSQR